MSPQGHLEALPPPRVSGGYQFSNPTFAGSAATDGNAPVRAIRGGRLLGGV
jgi:hypothetical protein